MDRTSKHTTWPIHPIITPPLPPSLPPKHRHLLSPPRYRKAKRTKLGTADASQTTDSFLLLDLLMYVLSLPLKRKPPAAAEAVPSNTLASRSTVKVRRACCGPRCATTMALLSGSLLPGLLFGLGVCGVVYEKKARLDHGYNIWSSRPRA